MLDSFRIPIQCFIFLSLCIRINAFQAGKFKGLQHTFENEIKSGKKQYAVNRRESSSFSKPSQKNYNGRNNRLQKQRLPQNKSMQHYRAVNSEIIAGRNVKDILEVFVNQGGLRPVNNEDRRKFAYTPRCFIFDENFMFYCFDTSAIQCCELFNGCTSLGQIFFFSKAQRW